MLHFIYYTDTGTGTGTDTDTDTDTHRSGVVDKEEHQGGKGPGEHEASAAQEGAQPALSVSLLKCRKRKLHTSL